MIATLKLVEKQIAMSDIRNRANETAPQPGRYVTDQGIAFGPCLLISRECGSGTGKLAQAVGARLGWNVFDSKIVDEIANVAHVHQRLVESVDEHVHSQWEQTWRELLLDELPDKKYLRHLQQIILTLGYQGNVVLVGRGAQYLLPPQCALRLRLVAPLEYRTQHIAKYDGLSLEQARAKAIKIDSERATFVRKYFRKEIDSPLNNDLIINTAEISIEGAVRIVLDAIAEKLGVPLTESAKFTLPPNKFAVNG